MGKKTLLIAAGAIGFVAALAMPASAESYKSLTKANPVAKDVWSSAGDNVRHKPSGAECALEQGGATLTFLKTIQGQEGDAVLKTACRYELPSGANWTVEIESSKGVKTDDLLLQFGTAARSEVGGIVGAGPGPTVTAVKTSSGQLVPYALAIFSEDRGKRSAIWFGDVHGWRITVMARLYSEAARKEVEQAAADSWALAGATAFDKNTPPKAAK